MNLKKIICLGMTFLMAVQADMFQIKAAAKETKFTEYEVQLDYAADEVDGNTFGVSAYNISETVEDVTRYSGIRAFEVQEDGSIMLMDAEAKKILIYRGAELESSIDLSFCADPQYFVSQDNVVIVFDLTSSGKLYYINMNGNLVEEKVLPENINPSTITGFYSRNGENYLLTLEKELISLPDLKNEGVIFGTDIIGEEYTVSYENMAWSFQKSGRDFFNPLYVDEAGCLYIEKSTVAQGTEYIQGETYLLKIDANGNEMASMRLKLEDYTAFPNQFYDFCDGSLYVLELFENHCDVAKVKMGTQREASKIAQMEQYGASKEKVAALPNRAANAISVSKTRSEVEATASKIISSTWTVKKENKTALSGTTLPQCVSDASVGDTITGIPYCWGGYDTLDNILKNLSKGSMAGNVNKKVVSGSVGYDCSGYVSYCYGLGQHIATSSLSTSVAVSKIDYANMQSMDMILKSGHVMLFKNFSGNYVTVYEATSEGAQKTREHSYTINHIFVTLSYNAYTPW